MTTERSEFAHDALNASLTSAQVAAAAQFLESFQSSTQALRALVAAICSEHEDVASAAILESVIEQFADSEAETV